jgi:hypothetical protein
VAKKTSQVGLTIMGQPKGSTRRAMASPPRSGKGSRLRDAVISLDAEDIAMARLQASMRRAETIQAAPPAAASPLGRTTVRLPADLLKRGRGRAKRERATFSEIVAQALERFL